MPIESTKIALIEFQMWIQKDCKLRYARTQSDKIETSLVTTENPKIQDSVSAYNVSQCSIHHHQQPKRTRCARIAHVKSVNAIIKPQVNQPKGYMTIDKAKLIQNINNYIWLIETNLHKISKCNRTHLDYVDALS